MMQSRSFQIFLCQVDWETEMECFETFAAAMADFYAMHPPFLPNPNGDESSQTYYVGKSKQALITGKTQALPRLFVIILLGALN